MSNDPIELLARVNPVPPTVTPAPIDGVLARIAAAPAPERPPLRPRARPLRWLAPAVGVGLALAIAVAAIVLVHGPAHHPRTPAATHTTVTSPPRKTGTVPSGGMRGVVGLSGIAFTSPDDGLVSFSQCTKCSSRHPRFVGWLATTHDAGRSWAVARAPYTLQDPLFADAHNGWAFGTSASRAALYYVTHDGGASWTPAHLADGQIAYTTPLVVAEHTVWAIGNRCSTTGCTYAVLRGNAAGSTLTPAAAQPAPHAETMIISAGSARTAYATTSIDNGRAARTYATHDGGRHWSTIAPGCRDSAPIATSNSVLWETCNGHTLAISQDGGRRWHLRHSAASAIGDLVPTSATTAWLLTDHNELLRTTTAGQSWQTYRYTTPRLPRREAATPAPLGVLSATSAAIAVDYPTGHGRTQILVIRADGPTSSSSYITLPPGLG